MANNDPQLYYCHPQFVDILRSVEVKKVAQVSPYRIGIQTALRITLTSGYCHPF